MLEAVRLSLRLVGDTFDAEIADIIEACKLDLKIAGVGVAAVSGANDQPPDPLILRAVTLYAKGHFGFMDMGEKYMQAYEALKVSLCLAGDYRA